MKSIKFKTIIFSILIVVMALTIANFASAVEKSTAEQLDWIQLQISIPIPNCNKVDSSIIKCSNGQITAIKDLPSYIVVIFQFGIILIASVMVVLMIVGGLIYMTSAGDKTRADKGLTYIKNTAYALIAVLFSYFILNTINPNLTDLKIEGATNIKQKLLCEEIPTPTKCNNKKDSTNNALCIWTGKKTEPISGYCTNIGDVVCKDLLEEASCERLKNTCEWIDLTKTNANANPKGVCVTTRIASNCEGFKVATCTGTKGTTTFFAGTQGGSMNVGCQVYKGCHYSNSKVALNPGANTLNCYDKQLADKISCNAAPGCEFGDYCTSESNAAIALQNVNCGDFHDPSECPVEKCYYTGEVCQDKISSGEACPMDVASAQGGRYIKNDYCVSGFYCDSTKKCVPRKTQGKSCDPKNRGWVTQSNGPTIFKSYECKPPLTCYDENNTCL